MTPTTALVLLASAAPTSLGFVMIPTAPITTLSPRLPTTTTTTRPHHQSFQRSAPLFAVTTPEKSREESAEALARKASQLREEARQLESSMEFERRQKLESELDAFFREADANGDGAVTLQELRAALRRRLLSDDSEASERSKLKLERLLENDARLEQILTDLDKNSDGALQRDEFVSVEMFRERLEAQFKQERAVDLKLKRKDDFETALKERLEAFEKTASSTDAKTRALAALAYLLPALDALPFSAPPPGAGTSPEVDAVLGALVSAAVLWRSLPFSGIFALLALNGLGNDPTAPRLARFAARHAVILDIVAAVLLPLGALVSQTPVPGTALEVAILVSTILAVANGSSADFFPGSGRLAKKLVDDFDRAVKNAIEVATAADFDLLLTTPIDDALRKRLEDMSQKKVEEEEKEGDSPRK